MVDVWFTPTEMRAGIIDPLEEDRYADTWRHVPFVPPFEDVEHIVVIPMTQTYKGRETPGLRIQNVNHFGFDIRFDEVVILKEGEKYSSEGRHVNTEVVGWVAFGGQPEGPPTRCCSEIGGISLDFSTATTLPVGVLVTFTFGGVEFTRVYSEISFGGSSLKCTGSEEVPPGSGNFNDAAVRLDFGTLPCLVCKILAEVDGHGPEARLVGRLRDGTTQTAVCPGDKRTLTLTTGPDKPFISATLSGQEAEWFGILLE